MIWHGTIAKGVKIIFKETKLLLN